MELHKIMDEVTRDEGLRLKPYRDGAGKLTIGIGRNLDDVGLSREEAEFMLQNDIDSALADLNRNIPWWIDLPEAVRRALVNMVFNLGWPRFSSFKKMLAALEAGDFEAAASEALDSKWARQVGDRAERIAAKIRGGNEIA